MMREGLAMAWKNSPKGRLLTIGEETPRFGYPQQTIYNAIYSGAGELAKLPFYLVGRSIRFAEEDINAFLEQRRVEPRAGTAGGRGGRARGSGWNVVFAPGRRKRNARRRYATCIRALVNSGRA